MCFVANESVLALVSNKQHQELEGIDCNNSLKSDSAPEKQEIINSRVPIDSQCAGDKSE